MSTAPHPNANPAWLLLVPGLLLIAMHLLRLGNAPMAGTEPHRILVAQQMSSGESGWLVPTLYGKPYLRKPPLHYWVLASVDRLLGGASVTTFRLVSVVEAALTAVVVTLFATRWFGRPAGLVAGFSFVVAVALWSQSRSGDIDALNTLLTTLCACTLIELQMRTRGAGASSRRTLTLAIILSIAFAGVLLAKGPAGLPVIVGALVGPALATRSWRVPLKLSVLVPLLVGAIVFAGYAILAQQALARSGAPPDTSGLSEAAQWMTPDLDRLGKALLIVPQLFGYALPLSVFVVLALVPEVRQATVDADEDRLTRSLAWSVVVGWLVCFLTLMVNPRYGNVIVPMLCPLSGAIFMRMFRSERGKDALRVVIACCVIAAAVAAVGLTIARWRDDPGRVATMLAAAGSAVVAIFIIAMLRRRQLLAPAALTVIGFALLSVPVNAHDDHRARLRSGQAVAADLRAAISDDRPVIAGQVVFAHPELFHYAGVAPRWLAEQLLNDRDVPDDCWLVLDDAELAWWRERHAASLGPARSLRTYRKVFHVVRRLPTSTD
jgi:4-amino-4-deoxy-L-arabinose transferase-like glycosyltransferase